MVLKSHHYHKWAALSSRLPIFVSTKHRFRLSRPVPTWVLKKTKNRDKTMLPFSFKIEMEFGQNRHWKRKNVKNHYHHAHFAAQNLCFYPSKTMVSLPKNYGFAPQNLCFYNPKPMFFSANIWFLRSRKTHFLHNHLSTSNLQNTSQNAHISLPSHRLCSASPVWEPSTQNFHDNFMRRNRSVQGTVFIRSS